MIISHRIRTNRNRRSFYDSFFWFVSQTDVSDGTRDVRRQRPGRGRRRLLPVGVESALLRSAGRGAGGRQALPLRLPPVVVAGGGGGGHPRPAPERLHTPPASPFTADQLRKQIISFEKVKLTNNEMDKQGQVGRALVCL